MIGAKTRLCAVIGDPVEHSLSPAIHNAAFQALGLDWVYTAFRVLPDRLRDAISGVRGLGIRGLSVTIPHKVAIIPFLDEVDDLASWTGSVNTVVNDEGRLTGHTTDGRGALAAFAAAGESCAGRRVLVLGSGGAARAVSFAIARDARPESIKVLGIVQPERERLAEDISGKTGVPVTSGGMERLAEAIGAAQVIIHASPVGMHPEVDETLVPRRLLRRDLVVFDAVYTPLKTRLLREAEEAGARTIPGVGMFVGQAAVQFELWTGKKAPVAAMEEVVLAALRTAQG